MYYVLFVYLYLIHQIQFIKRKMEGKEKKTITQQYPFLSNIFVSKEIQLLQSRFQKRNNLHSTRASLIARVTDFGIKGKRISDCFVNALFMVRCSILIRSRTVEFPFRDFMCVFVYTLAKRVMSTIQIILLYYETIHEIDQTFQKFN